MANNDYMEFSPVKFYNTVGKKEFSDNAEAYFEELTKRSNIDVDENKATVKKIKSLEEKLNKLSKKLNILRGFTAFFIVLCVVSFIVAAIGIVILVGDGDLLTGVLMIVFGILCGIGFILLIVLYFNKQIKNNSKIEESLKKEYNTQLLIAKNQLAPLINSFTFKDFVNVVNKTNNNFTLDDQLEPEKLLMLDNLFNFNPKLTDNDSLFEVESGNIEKNPFIRLLILEEVTRDKVYTGTRVVSWVVTVSNGKGGTYTTTRTQTLVAHYSAPAAFYGKCSYVIYGNEAAPDLKFTRNPSGYNYNQGEKDLKKFIKSRSKTIQDKYNDSMSKGGSFTPISNMEFESLFYALDRNNEQQYRILFTPLAQRNLVDLISKETPYGDDFSFQKFKKLNIISSSHSQTKISMNLDQYIGYWDYEVLKNDYLNEMNKEHTSLYFDLAPLLCVPLYQMSEPSVFNPMENLTHISIYEAEAFVNHMKEELFIHPDAKTPQILKLNFINSKNNTDVFEVCSYAFDKIQRIAEVPVVAGNGSTYLVPVVWYEYIPVSRTTKVAMAKIPEKTDQVEAYSDDNIISYRYKNFASLYLGDEEDLDDTKESIFEKLIKNRYNLFK